MKKNMVIADQSNVRKYYLFGLNHRKRKIDFIDFVNLNCSKEDLFKVISIEIWSRHRDGLFKYDDLVVLDREYKGIARINDFTKHDLILDYTAENNNLDDYSPVFVDTLENSFEYDVLDYLGLIEDDGINVDTGYKMN